MQDICNAQKLTFRELENLEREPLRYCKGDGKVTLRIDYCGLRRIW